MAQFAFYAPKSTGKLNHYRRRIPLDFPAVLPGTGRDPLLHLDKEADAEGYGVALDGGALVGHCELFDEALLDGMNVAIGLIRSPWSLACLLEAAGPLALERCGALLDRWIAENRTPHLR